MLARSRHYSWTIKLVNDLKADIKQELTAVMAAANDPKDRLTHILLRISELEANHSDEGRLRRLIYGMSALIHHEKRGGLTDKQEDDICELVSTLLKVQDIDPERSVLSGLYNEYHLVLGQLQRKRGDHWAAAWEQFLGNRFAIHHDSNAEVYQTLATANRLLRLGHRADAEAMFQTIDGTGDDNTRFRARMGLILCRRLTGALADAKQLVDAAIPANTDFAPAWVLDLQWERLVCGMAETQDTTELLAATQKGQPHFEATYIVEAILLTLGMKKKTLMERLRPVHALRRDRSLGIKERWPLLVATELIQKAYDASIPLEVRLQDVGKALMLAKQVPAIDREMMVWVAAARWFYRMHMPEPLLICLGSYEALSMRLTNYAHRDALGFAGDMCSSGKAQA